jgi:acetylornithine deacetylase/succinyl-diaminopimelate desuccinylase-like protein
MRASQKLNVIPPEAVADIDCRVLAGDDPDELRAWVTRAIDDDHVRVEFAREPKVPNLSPPDTEMYKALTRRAPGVVVAPEILVAFTDSWVFRRMGLQAYGWSPFILDDEEWSRVHGNDERISLDNLREGARAYTELLVQMAGA